MVKFELKIIDGKKTWDVSLGGNSILIPKREYCTCCPTDQARFEVDMYNDGLKYALDTLARPFNKEK